MKLHKIIKSLIGVIFAFIIAGGVIYFLATRSDESRGTVSIWYVESDVLAEGLEKLCEEYNSSHPRTALPVSLRAFDTEDRLAAECENTLPDIIVCPHQRAFDLGARSRLTALVAELERPVDYPMTLSSRNAAIGKSFFPVGCDTQVLLTNKKLCNAPGFDTLGALCAAALEYTAGTAQPFFAVDDYAALFYTQLLCEGEEFSAAVKRGTESENYRTLYNLLAECAYSGALAVNGAAAAEVLAGRLPCAIVRSSALHGAELKDVGLYPLPPLSADKSAAGRLCTAYGLAVTAGGSRSADDIAAFLDWLFSGGRDTKLALGAALIPAQSGEVMTHNELWSALLALADGSIPALPGGDDEFSENRADFHADICEKMAFLSE